MVTLGKNYGNYGFQSQVIDYLEMKQMNDLGLLDFSHYNAMQDNARKTEALSETLKKST